MTTSKPVNQVNLRNIVLEMLLQVNKGEKSHVALKSTLDKMLALTNINDLLLQDFFREH